jgi:methionine sulfoxide reductase catalytic subunit
MMLLISKSKYKEIAASEITPPEIFQQRRLLLKTGLATAVMGTGLWTKTSQAVEEKLQATSAEHVKNYTNYYEFSYNKQDPTELAQKMRISPWSVEISGAVEKPGVYHLEDILKAHPVLERIYRFRCVEAWSMVVPWLGFPLADLLKQFKPTANAKFVQFTTAQQPDTMPNLSSNRVLVWPYTEALRMDEAMHPLTLLATGMYGEALPKQNGAPLRLIVPWKYGFKSIKAIVKIHFLENQPISSWNRIAPSEYGFYANVNPAVPHPRWSQSSERVLGAGLFTPRRATELFNGYAEQVASLYSNLNLVRNF